MTSQPRIDSLRTSPLAGRARAPRRAVAETASDRLVARFAWTAVTMSFLSLLLVPLTLR